MVRKYDRSITARGLAVTLFFFGVIAIQVAAGQSPGAPAADSLPAEMVSCTVVYDNVTSSGTLSNKDQVIVPVAKIKELPAEPPVSPVLVDGAFALGRDVTTKLAKHVQTKAGPILETYEGKFTNIVADESFAAVGGRIVMKPERWLPSSPSSSENIAELQKGHLRASWVRKSPKGGANVSDVTSCYFAVSVQLFSRNYHLKTALFSGKKTTEADDGSVFGSLFRSKQVVELKDSTVTDMSLDGVNEIYDLPNGAHEIYPRGVPFRLAQ